MWTPVPFFCCSFYPWWPELVRVHETVVTAHPACLLSWALLAQRAGEPSLGLLTWQNKVAIRWVTSFVLYSPMHGIKPTLWWEPEFIWVFLNVSWICWLSWAVVVKGSVWGHLQGASHILCSCFCYGKAMYNLCRQKLLKMRQASKEWQLIWN